MQRVGVLTGGGDCPGLNGAIKWVLKTSMSNLPQRKTDVVEVIGIRGEHGLERRALERQRPCKAAIQ